MHTAFRVAQGQVAVAAGSAPEEMAPTTCFPWLAVASLGLTGAEVACITIPRAHPGIALQKPPWQDGALAWTTIETIRVEPRKGRRKRDKNLCYFLLYLPSCGVRRGSGKDSTQLVRGLGCG